MDELELISHAHIVLTFASVASPLVNVALPCSETLSFLCLFKPTEELRNSFCFKFYLVISKIYKVLITFLVFAYSFIKV